MQPPMENYLAHGTEPGDGVRRLPWVPMTGAQRIKDMCYSPAVLFGVED